MKWLLSLLCIAISLPAVPFRPAMTASATGVGGRAAADVATGGGSHALPLGPRAEGARPQGRRFPGAARGSRLLLRTAPT